MPNTDAIQAQEDDRSINAASLFARYRAPLVRYFVRYGYVVDVAEDCVQDVFIRISRSDLVSIHNIEAYLFAVASSVAMDHKRKMRSRQALQHDSIDVDLPNVNLVSQEASPYTTFEDRETLLHLRDVLNELKPRTREIFLLNRFDDLSYTQLATRFGLSVAAIEKQMSKALAHLRRRLPRK